MIEYLVRKFLYYPDKIRADEPLPPHCADAREVWITTSTGDEIHGLYWPPPPGAPTIAFFHGNAQSVYEWAMVRQDLEGVEAGMLLVDYPGYGKSTGRPTERSLYAAGRASLSWLASDRSTPEQDIVVFGKSLGGGVAVEVSRGKSLKGLVLESTFSSIPSVARILLPLVPTDAVFAKERYDSLSKIGDVHCPVLVVHGTGDGLIPIDEGRALFEGANPPKEMYEVKGAGHNNVSLVAGRAYSRTIARWLEGVS
jgi:hypothetical protein